MNKEERNLFDSKKNLALYTSPDGAEKLNYKLLP
jgi:hypothetical protein